MSQVLLCFPTFRRCRWVESVYSHPYCSIVSNMQPGYAQSPTHHLTIDNRIISKTKSSQIKWALNLPYRHICYHRFFVQYRLRYRSPILQRYTYGNPVVPHHLPS
jgi:hypothetical protein